MKYIRLKWNHANPDEPVWIFSEVDGAGKEIRKIECFKNGFCDVASTEKQSGTASLMTLPLPDIKALSRDPEFIPVEITKEQFEEVWTKRQFRAPEAQ